MRYKVIPKIQSKLELGELLKATMQSLGAKSSIPSFERGFSALVQRRHAVAAHSGRSAFIAILRSLDLKKGDEILLPGFTFVGLPRIIRELGFEPVFVETSKRTLNIKPEKISELVSPRSRALLLVHNLGNPNDMERITEICKKHDLVLIEDCAHTVGSRYKGQLLGTFGEVSFFSFHYSKIINTHWGGMACTDNDVLAGKIRSQVACFSRQSTKQLLSRLTTAAFQGAMSQPLLYSTLFYYSNKLYRRYTGKDIIDSLYQLKPQQVSAHEFQFTSFQAAIGLQQLEKLHQINMTRRRYYSLFQEALKDKIEMQEVLIDADFIPLQIVIFSRQKEQTIRWLAKHKIEARDFFIPALLTFPEFKGCRNNCEEAFEIGKEIIYFPTFHLQQEKDIRYIGKVLGRNPVKGMKKSALGLSFIKSSS